VLVLLLVLHVDDARQLAARQHRHRQERFVPVLGQLVERLEPRILERMTADRHGLAVFGDPPGDAFAHTQGQAIDDVGMWPLGGAKHQVIALEHVDEHRVARNHARDELHDAIEHRMQRIGRRDAAADFVEDVDVAGVGHGRNRRDHDPKIHSDPRVNK
jgi:hypothetical protein